MLGLVSFALAMPKRHGLPGAPGLNAIEQPHRTARRAHGTTRGLKRLLSARVISAGHAFIQNYELATDIDPRHRIPQAFTELTFGHLS